MQTLKWILFVLALVFLYIAVYNFSIFRRNRKRFGGKSKTIQDIKKILATGKPETVPANQVPIAKLSRRVRRAAERNKSGTKSNKKHLDGVMLARKISQERDRIRQGEIIEANEFLHILKPNNGKSKKA